MKHDATVHGTAPRLFGVGALFLMAGCGRYGFNTADSSNSAGDTGGDVAIPCTTLLAPDAIANLGLWLRGDNVDRQDNATLTGGQQIAEWDDLSAAAHLARADSAYPEVVNGPRLITAGRNGHDVVRFEGDQALHLSTLVATGDVTVVFVVANEDTYPLIDDLSAVLSTQLFASCDTRSGFTTYSSNGFVSPDVPVIRMEVNSCGDTGVLYQLNGGAQYSTNILLPFGPGVYHIGAAWVSGVGIASGAALLGAARNFGAPPTSDANMILAELVIYLRILDDTERQGLYCYLSDRWGIALQ